jgi:outer membrane lipoprotein-sorting protein
MLKKAVGFLALAATIALPAAAQSVDEIIAKNLAAQGGEAKIRAVKSIRFTGKIEFGPAMQAPITLELKRPGMVRQEFTIQGMTGVQAYDGKAGWQVMPFQGKTDAEPMPADEVKIFEDQAEFEGPLMDYKTKGNTVELLGKDKVEGAEVYKLKVIKKNGMQKTIFIDADSSLEVKNVTKMTIHGTEVEQENTLSDYREVGGLMLPFAIESGQVGNPQKQHIVIEKIELDPPIDNARFAMPPPKPPEPPKPEAKPGESKP